MQMKGGGYYIITKTFVRQKARKKDDAKVLRNTLDEP